MLEDEIYMQIFRFFHKKTKILKCMQISRLNCFCKQKNMNGECIAGELTCSGLPFITKDSKWKASTHALFTIIQQNCFSFYFSSKVTILYESLQLFDKFATQYIQ